MNRASFELNQESVMRGFDRFPAPQAPSLIATCTKQDAFLIVSTGLGERV
jgi:hypothetical protein